MRNHRNPYATDRERWEWYRRFTLTPVAPRDIEARLDDGESLQTVDLPTHLGHQALTDCETGVGLYRLVQLWGTPNVPGRTAGAVRHERGVTTWQYLFDVEYDRAADDDAAIPDAFRLSVYDYKTDISAGLSVFAEATAAPGTVHDPAGEPTAEVSMPPASFLTGVVGLVLNMVDEAVPATHKEVWV